MTTRVADHPRFLQSARNLGETRAPNSQHLRDLLLGERKFIAAVQVGARKSHRDSPLSITCVVLHAADCCAWAKSACSCAEVSD